MATKIMTAKSYIARVLFLGSFVVLNANCSNLGTPYTAPEDGLDKGTNTASGGNGSRSSGGAATPTPTPTPRPGSATASPTPAPGTPTVPPAGTPIPVSTPRATATPTATSTPVSGAKTVIGHVDSVSANGISGWACAKGETTPIEIHFYVLEANNTQTYIGALSSNQSNESAVHAACVTSGRHRFVIPLSSWLLETHGGKRIRIYGISPVSSAGNLPLANSDNLYVPVTVPTPTRAIYRMQKPGDYLVTNDLNEGLAAGYVHEATIHIFETPGAGRQAIYRCWTGATHFVSIHANCEGLTSEGVLGYLYSAQMSGSNQGIYRNYNPTTGVHLLSGDPNEGASVGYVNEHALGYIPSAR